MESAGGWKLSIPSISQPDWTMAAAFGWHATPEVEIKHVCMHTHTTETLDKQKRGWRLDLTDFKLNSSLKYDLDAKKVTLTEPQLKDSGV